MEVADPLGSAECPVGAQKHCFDVATAEQRTRAAGGWAGTEIGVIMSKTWFGRLGHREQADRWSGGDQRGFLSGRPLSALVPRQAGDEQVSLWRQLIGPPVWWRRREEFFLQSAATQE